MLNAYERHLLVFYLANAVSRLHYRDRSASELFEWLAEGDHGLVFRRARRRRGKDFDCVVEEELFRGREREAPPGGGLPERVRHRLAQVLPEEPWHRLDDRLARRTWRRLGTVLREEAVQPPRGDRTVQRLRRLGRTTGLSRTDVRILDFGLRYWTQPVIESVVDKTFGGTINRRMEVINVNCPILPTFLGESSHAISGRFGADAPLVRSGLVSVDDDGDVKFNTRLRRLVTAPGGARLDVNRLLLGDAAASELEWSDFDHLGNDRDHAERLLRGALDSAGTAGVNILLHGPPGTGKTELCKVLAERLGVTLYSVGESDENGDEPSRHERLQELRLAQRLLAADRRSVLLFDEMEDLLSDPVGRWAPWGVSGSARAHRGGQSRVFMNRLLEESPVPVLWTTNQAREVCPTVLRRMMFALELRLPPPRVRARIWARQLAGHGIEAGAGDAESLAREFEVTPGVASGVTAAARLGGGGVDAVRRGVRSLSRVLSVERPPPRVPEKFAPALLQADIDSVGLADRLAASGRRRFSLCLQGPPGTGKSAFVRHLAERPGLEVEQKRASDLLSMWVGDTEQRIAAAFAEARDAQSFLVFDEADSLLADRRFATRTWEISQVNEMLTWMESHPLPFACTTNFAEHLDGATLRRFTFKVTLDYLAPEQALAAFRHYFAIAAPARVATLTNLTPGDFAVVRDRAEVLGCAQEPETLATMLREECEAKPDRPSRIGFVA